MDHRRNQEQDERQMRYKLSKCYRWLWVGIAFGLLILATMMDSCLVYGKELPHACCYCRCGVKDYHKDCDDLCVLPPKNPKEVRTFTSTEDKMCVRLCRK